MISWVLEMLSLVQHSVAYLLKSCDNVIDLSMQVTNYRDFSVSETRLRAQVSIWFPQHSSGPCWHM